MTEFVLANHHRAAHYPVQLEYRAVRDSANLVKMPYHSFSCSIYAIKDLWDYSRFRIEE
jgi:hypothetical protein